MKKYKIAAALFAVWLGKGVALATDFVWSGNAGDGNWFTPGNWTPNGTPGAGDNASLANGNTATIGSSLDDTGGTILASGAGSTIKLGSGGVITGGSFSTTSGGVILAGGGTLNSSANAGTITFDSSGLFLQGTIDNSGVIQSDGSVNSAYLYDAANGQPTTLSGGGSVLLNKANASLAEYGGGGFINQDNLIHGFGTITASLINDGTVSADSSGNTLVLGGSAKTNNGTIMATNGGILLVGTTITGGTLQTSNGGVITGNGNGILNNLTNAGTLTFGGSGLFLTGTINNTGVIEPDSSGNAANLYDAANGQPTTLTGGGSVLLTKSNATLAEYGGGGFINQDNLIHGFGSIGAGLANSGTVSADSSGNTLTLNNASKSNSGILQAIDGGTLAINSGMSNTNGMILADGAGSTVMVGSSGIITGGSLNTSSGGMIVAAGGTLSGVANAGTVAFNSSGLLLQGTIDNSGVIESDGSANAAYLYDAANGQPTTLSGGGSVLLTKSNATMAAYGGGGFINQNNLIHGFGQINAILTNDGTISADSSGNMLVLGGSAKTNNGTIMATNGGILVVGTTITGGTLQTSNGGVITGNGNGILNNLTNAGTLTFGGSGLYLTGTINNTGVIEPDSSVNPAYLYDAGNGQPTTLTGGGSILLTKSNATLAEYGGGGFINQDNLIHGFGSIGAGLANSGTVSADSNGNTLTLNNLPKSNSGTFQAINGGTLQIGSLTVTQGAGGQIAANGSGGMVNLSGSTINGGKLAATGGGAIVASGATIAVGPVSLASGGTLTLSSSTSTLGQITGNGQVAINGGSAKLTAGGGASQVSSLTLSGSGTLDITNNSLAINYGTAADPVATIRGYLKSAYNGGIWTGPGLTSSAVAAQVAATIAAHTGGVYGIGYVDGGVDKNQAAKALVHAVGNQIIYAPALIGDANLDGSVTFIDLGIVAQNLGAINSDWEHGDFNYDGTTNFLDIGLLAQNLSKTVLNTPLDEMIADPSAAVTAQWNLAVAELAANETEPANLPEPGMIGLLAIGAGGLLVRRRRRRA